MGAGLDFTLRLGRRLHLPTLGSVRASTSDSALLRHRSGTLTLAGTELFSPDRVEPAAWDGIRMLHNPATTADPFAVALDDLHPHRAPFPLIAAPRLPRDELHAWQALFAAAWRHLSEWHDPWATQLRQLLAAVTPVRASGPRSGLSATSWQSFGAVALTWPGDAVGFCATLVHEAQHAKLNALIDLVELCDPTEPSLHYAPWRADPRPVGSLLNGCYAFLGVADFWARERAVPRPVTSRAEYEFARVALQVEQVIDELAGAPGLTPEGRRFVDGMARRAKTFDARSVADPAYHLAALACDDHRVGWRLHNLTVDPAVVKALAAAWHAGQPPPPALPSRLTPTSESFVESRRMEWLTTLARQPALRARQLPGTTADGPSIPPAVREADQRLADADFVGAVDRYLAALLGNENDESAWTGLALACRRLDRPGAELWHHRPELVRAVYRELAAAGEPPDLFPLVGWLARGDA